MRQALQDLSMVGEPLGLAFLQRPFIISTQSKNYAPMTNDM
jgi:hypothetical protein